MPRLPQFQLIFAPEATEHLAAINRKHHRLIEEAIDEQLTHTPASETRNRKPLRQPDAFRGAMGIALRPSELLSSLL
jgi:hypothetical protein